MKSTKLILSALWLIIFTPYSSFTQQSERDHFDCFSILVGKNASEDGSVMLAHNEDDWGERIVNWYKVPSMKHKEGSQITLKNGAGMSQANKTYSYLWLEMPEMEFSDSYMNEWGVTIASDACLSREKKGDITDGGIGYWLRRAMAERAKTAREAVQIGGALIEEFGYTSSGRTYCISGQTECWMLSAVQGKHWVAQRVPNDHVAIIPNYYTITNVDLTDSLNFYGSADLIDYAKKKKWYNPDKDGEFNFREAYSDPKNLENMGNLVRHWDAINALSVEKYNIEDEFPFSFKPKNKIPLTVLFSILRSHSEGTEYDQSENYTLGNPHEHGRAICSNTTQYGFVVQIRNNLPNEIGTVMWLSPFRPCVHPFTQWYMGITEIPENFYVGEFRTALIDHFEPIENMRKFAPDHHFLEYVKHAKSVDKTYGRQIKVIHQNLIKFEQELIDNQASFEKRLIEIQSVDPRQSNKMMTDYTEKQIQRSLEMIQK